MELKQQIESVLFITGEPVSIKKLEKVLKQDRAAIEPALAELQKEYASRGLVIMHKEDEWQFGTNPDNAVLIEDLMKSEFTAELSRAALETLAIVAYKGPLTRAELEFIRGVNSSFTVRNLLMRGLIERVDNPKDARSYLYKVSFDFLKHLGLTSIGDLPEYGALQAKADELVSQMEEKKPETSEEKKGPEAPGEPADSGQSAS